VLLKNLYMENFLSYKKCDVNFDTGITSIIGLNGAGKTTLLEAISFALFKDIKDRSVLSLHRLGTSQMKVALTFVSSNRTYRVVREYRKGKHVESMLLEVRDEAERQIQGGGDEVTDEIVKILNMNSEVFRNAVYIRQGEIGSLVEAVAGERKKIVGKLIGADELEVAYDSFFPLIRAYEGEIQTLDSELKTVESVRKEMDDTQKNCEVLRHGISEVQRRIKNTEATLGERRRVLGDIEEKRKKAEKLEVEKGKVKTELKHETEKREWVSRQMKTLEETKESARRYDAAGGEIEKLRSSMREYEGSASRMRELENLRRETESKAASLEKDAKGMVASYQRFIKFSSVSELAEKRDSRMTELESNRRKVETEYEQVSSSINSLKGENKNLEAALSGLESAVGKCPVCGTELTEEHRKEIMAEYRAKTGANKNEIARLESLLKKKSGERDSAMSEAEKLRSINVELLSSIVRDVKEGVERLKKIDAEMEDCRKDAEKLNALEKTMREMEKTRRSLESTREKFIAAKNFLEQSDAGALDSKIGELNEKLSGIDAELRGAYEAVGHTPEGLERAYSDIKREYERTQEGMTGLRVEEAGKKASLIKEEEHLRRKEVELAKLRESAARLEKLQKFLSLLKKIREIFSKDFAQKELRARAKPLIEKYTNEVFGGFELPFANLKITDDYDLILSSADGERSMDMISGGEKIAAALALRAGIAKALSGGRMELLMLDEPTIHLDDIRRRELVEIVKNLTMIPQTIVVTHDEEFENAADIILKVRKEDGVSLVESVERQTFVTMDEKMGM
jgi:exonuclease SbcC